MFPSFERCPSNAKEAEKEPLIKHLGDLQKKVLIVFKSRRCLKI